MNTLHTRIFVDFWNLQLNLYEHQGRDYKLDWKVLSPCLLGEAENILNVPLQFEGTHCPHCHQLIENCPHCNKRMLRTVEKGIV